MLKYKLQIVAIIGILLLSGTATADLNTGLVAYYPFDGNSHDKTTNQNDGFENGTPQYVIGAINQGVSFDGMNSYISIPNASQINFNTNQDFSVTAFVQASSVQPDSKYPDNNVIEKWSGGSIPYPFVIRYGNQTGSLNGKVYGASYDVNNNPVIVSSPIKNNAFNHIAFIKQGTLLNLYINGNLSGTIKDTTKGTTVNNSPLFIGRRGGSEIPGYFKGVVDELRIYNRALSADEVQQLYNQVVVPVNQGIKGDKGDPGPAGPQGLKGDKGDTGITGAVGAKGEQGLPGKDGAQGIHGVKGDTGLTGAVGAKGDQGLPGKDGAQGIQGVKGDTGLTGAVGAKGDQGLPGKDGAQGIQGVKGDTGLTGAVGAKGDQGLPGKDGINGKDGAQGIPAINPPNCSGNGNVLQFNGTNWQCIDATVKNTATYVHPNADSAFGCAGVGWRDLTVKVTTDFFKNRIISISATNLRADYAWANSAFSNSGSTPPIGINWAYGRDNAQLRVNASGVLEGTCKSGGSWTTLHSGLF